MNKSKFQFSCILAASLFICLSLLLSACDGITFVNGPLVTLPPPTPVPVFTPPAGAILAGPVQQNGYNVTINALDSSDKNATGGTANLGFSYLEVYMTVQSSRAKGVTFAPYMLTIQDGDGYSYPANFQGRLPQSQLTYDLPVGQSEAGWVEFEVHSNARNFTLVMIDDTTKQPFLQLSLPQDLKLAANPISASASSGSLIFSQFSPPEKTFSVSLPGQPQIDSLNGTKGGKSAVGFLYNVQTGQGGKIIYSVTYLDYGSYTPNRDDFQANLETDAFNLSTREITVGQLQGEEIEYKAQNNQIGSDKTIYYGKDRFLRTGNRLYILDVRYPRNTQIQAEIQNFFDSFRLTGN